MKGLLSTMLSLVFASISSAHPLYTKEQAIAYAKSIDVQVLDPSLPSHRLEDWLQSEPVHAETVIWTLQDTCWNKPSANEEYPLCVEVEAKRKKSVGTIPVADWDELQRHCRPSATQVRHGHPGF
jgi:hypothetical protein